MRWGFSLLVAVVMLTLLVSGAGASRSIPFDGMYAKYAGAGTVTMNDKTSQVQLTGSVTVGKVADGWSVIVSFSIAGLPQPPYVAARSIAFTMAENTRILSQSSEWYLPRGMYNLIWIPVPAPVGSSVQIGSTDNPFELSIVGTEPFEALGGSVECVVAKGSHTVTMPDYSYMVDGTAYYERNTGLLMGGTITAEYSSAALRLKVQGQISMVETNVKLGAWPWYVWLIPVAFVAVLIALVARGRSGRGRRVQVRRNEGGTGSERRLEEERTWGPLETRTCSYCGARMPLDFTHCAVCGAELGGEKE